MDQPAPNSNYPKTGIEAGFRLLRIRALAGMLSRNDFFETLDWINKALDNFKGTSEDVSRAQRELRITQQFGRVVF